MCARTKVSREEWLYRRYYLPVNKYTNPDGSATSRVFKLREKDNGKLSVDVKAMTTYEKSVGDPDRFFLFEIWNTDVEEIGLITEHAPLPDGSNDAHSVILGMTMEDEILPGELAKKSRRVFP